MEFLRFIFSSGWHYTGFLFLMVIAATVTIQVIREIKKPNQQKAKEVEARAEYWKSCAIESKRRIKRFETVIRETDSRKGGDEE